MKCKKYCEGGITKEMNKRYSPTVENYIAIALSIFIQEKNVSEVVRKCKSHYSTQKKAIKQINAITDQ